MAKQNNIRFDHKITAEMIEPETKVLDLGCGDGALLNFLKKNKSIAATGIEIDEQGIYKCVEKGISVIHGNIDSGLADYSDKSFDYVILSESLQQVLHPQHVILESLRVGKQVIVAIPNFCHWKARVQLFFKGNVPVTEELPFQWFDTPNLRFLSIKDFRSFCKIKKIKIVDERGITGEKEIRHSINLFARLGLFLLKKK